MTPKQRRFETNINFNISSKTTSFWYQLKKKKKKNIYIYISKLQHFNLNPKIITQLSLSHQSPNLSLSHKRLLLASLFLSAHFLPLLLLLLAATATWCHNSWSFIFSSLLFAILRKYFIEDFEFYAPPHNAFIEVGLCILFSVVLIYLLWIRFSFFIF